MLHSIPEERYGALTKPMTHAIEACVHCGFCLAACPTYRELGQEMDTPRGRIVLMKQVLEGGLSFESAQPHIDRCLGCLACEPACPSGVPYRDLISPFRALARGKVKATLGAKLRRVLAGQLLPYPNRFRWAAQIARRFKPFSAHLPASFRPMIYLLPNSLPGRERWPRIVPARGERRARVALLLGCAQQVLAPDINSATITVLTLNGVEVIIPQEQGCCGGLAWHTGDLASAQKFARRNLRAFPRDVDAILTNAAGCGSAMHEYSLIVRGTPDEGIATEFCRRVQDVSSFLMELGWHAPLTPIQRPYRVAYQDACHLINGLGVRQEPRSLLRTIPGLELYELRDAHLCCGSAGTYNLDQPEIAASLGRQKVEAILASGADVVATGNIGCLTQIQAHLARFRSPVRVRHTMQLLRDACINS